MQIVSNIFPRMSLHCKLDPVQYREYKYGLFIQCIPTISLPHIGQHSLCPYIALKHAFHLVPAPLSHPAFVIPASTKGGLISLTYGKFNSLLKLLIAKLNLDPSLFSAHSFRSRGATLAFQNSNPFRTN